MTEPVVPTDTRLFAGVDAGASKTRVVILDAQGAAIGAADEGGASLNGQAENAWATVKTALSHAMADTGIDGLTTSQLAVVVGIAGTEIQAAHARFVADAPVFASLAVVSDADIACAGAHALQDGAVVSVGTGVTGLARENGQIKRAAGWGFPHDDRGGGAWIGMEAVHATLAAHDGRTEPSGLSAGVLAQFDDVDALVAWACAARGSDFAQLARIAVDSAAAGDAQADRLMRRAAAEVTTVINTLAPAERPGAARGLPLALTGGLAQSITRYFDAMLRERLVGAQYEPAHGAALMAQASQSA